MKKLVFVLMSVLIMANTLSAQDYDISAQIRARSIMDDKDFNKNTDQFTFSEFRTRLGVEIKAPKGISGTIQLQDSRVYGTEPTTLSDTKNIDLHQAYLKMDDVFGLPFDVKLGRMEVKFANERLIGAVGWSNVGRSFDGSIITFNGPFLNIHFMGFQIQESMLAGDSLDNTFGGIWAELKTFKNYKTDIFLLNENIAKTDESRYTSGFYVKGNLGNLQHELEFAYQFGDIIQNGVKLDVAAFMAAFNVSYTFDSDIKPVVSAGVDYLSGDDESSDNKYQVFNTLYATNHKFYGHMDYFVNIPQNTYGLGLMDIHCEVSITPWKPVKIGINGHVFNSAVEVKFGDGSSTSEFGTEFELFGSLKYSENLDFQGGLSVFAPGDLFKRFRGEDTSLWGYMMAIVNL